MINQYDLVNCDEQWKPRGKCPYRKGLFGHKPCVQDAEKCHKWQPMPVAKNTKVATAVPQMEVVYMCQDDIMRTRTEQMISILSTLLAGRAGPQQPPPHIMGPHG